MHRYGESVNIIHLNVVASKGLEGRNAGDRISLASNEWNLKGFRQETWYLWGATARYGPLVILSAANCKSGEAVGGRFGHPPRKSRSSSMCDEAKSVL